MSTSPINSAFEKALTGLKKPDAQPLANLGGLLITTAAATSDGTVMLAGVLIAGTAQALAALQNVQSLNPELTEFLKSAAKELSSALHRLQPELAGDNPDALRVLEALGDLAKTNFELGQKAATVQNLLKIGGMSQEE